MHRPHCQEVQFTNSELQNHPLTYSEITSLIDGKDLSGMKQLWEDVAKSEARLNLIAKLQERELGFAEVEQFSLGLKYSLKSDKMKGKNAKPIQKVVRAAMDLKVRDESFLLKDLKKRREKMRRKVSEKYHHRSEKFRKIMRYLRQEAAKVKNIVKKKYRMKMKTLKEKFREDEEDD